MGEAHKGAAGGPAASHPEGELDYYEVDLRDYLRILWRGKWIILGVFLVAVGVAAIVSFRSPDIYRATAKLSVEAPQGLPFSYSPPSGNTVALWAQDPSVLSAASAASGLPREQLGGSLKTNVEEKTREFGDGSAVVYESFVDISLEGPFSPSSLGKALGAVIEALVKRGREHLARAIQGAQKALTTKREELSRKLAAWEEALSRAKERAEGQRREISAEIERLVGGSQDLPLGEKLTLKGYDLQRKLDVLYARLQQVELFLDSLERLGPAALPGIGGSYQGVEGSFASLEVQESELKELSSSPPSPIVPVQDPVVSRAGPNRKMNIAVAGVLGLFLGVLLAFFVHYLRSSPTSQ